MKSQSPFSRYRAVRISKRMLWAFSATLALAVAQVPQDPGSKAIPLSKVERMNKAPVSDQILRVKIPKPTEITLPNGLTVLVLEDQAWCPWIFKKTVQYYCWAHGVSNPV